MNNCQCGQPVRLRATRMTINRKAGVYHYIEHVMTADDCKIPNAYSCYMSKPYPKKDSEHAYHGLIKTWNNDNQNKDTTNDPTR